MASVAESARIKPLGYYDAFIKWWRYDLAPRDAEAQVLSFVPFFSRTDKEGRLGQVGDIDLGTDDGRYIHEFSVTREKIDPASATSLVILHGYGAGLGLFYRNFDGLTKNKQVQLYALDLLGMGLSYRPRWKIRAKDPMGKIEEAETFFTQSLEQWRIKKGIDRMVLMGHSFGGYLSCVYAMKYPQHVEKLILVSPVGIPRNPFVPLDPDTPVSNEVESSMASEFEDNTRKDVRMPRPLPFWVRYLWNHHVSPFSFIRNTGPLGMRGISFWTSRRFGTFNESQYNALQNYSYALFNGKASSEYAITYLLAPGAYARFPLIDRIKNLKCSTLFIYGSNDWMDVSAGYSAANQLKKQGLQSDCYVIPYGGHHMYLDNPEGFNKIVNSWLQIN